VVSCPHHFVDTARGWNNRHAIALARGEEGTEKGGSANHRDFRVTDGTCLTCGAWRGVLGLEPTPELYVQHLVEIFREVRRVLRTDGTCWVNLGDSYSGGTQTGRNDNGRPEKNRGWAEYDIPRTKIVHHDGLKPKDLVGIPWRVAFALQADGWWLRSDIIWAKPNPMPESITNRPTKSHEYLFLLTKSARYFYDGEAIKEPVMDEEYRTMGKIRPSLDVHYVADPERGRTKAGLSNQNGGRFTRNRRSVWTIATEPYPEAHFATFPEKLVEPCILAGTSERGACPTCGAGWQRDQVRQSDGSERPARGKAVTSPRHDGSSWNENGGRGFMPVSVATLGWSPFCLCPPADPVPCRVLDPFAGSGTTVAVAERLGRVGIGIELKAAYLRLAWARTRQAGLL
jgi:DNA modification methylase